MAWFELRTRSAGIITFYAPCDGGYVHLRYEDNPRWMQPCNGGGFRGWTLIANENNLEKVARRWWRQELRSNRMEWS